jgi:hypothetical protein
MACDPSGETPQQIVCGDQRHQKGEGQPHGVAAGTGRQRVDQKFHAILRAHRAADGTDHRCQNRGMRQHPPAHVAQQEGDRPCGVAAEAIHPKNLQRASRRFRYSRIGEIGCDKKMAAARPPYFAIMKLAYMPNPGPLPGFVGVWLPHSLSKGVRAHANCADCTVD